MKHELARGLTRWFDVAVAVTVLTVGAPLWMIIAGIVRFTSPGPSLHRSRRAGRDGVPFDLFKFRSMRIDDVGHGVTAQGDPRVTPVGRFLRRFKLDEVPQFFNVLRGEMSLVGPRPENPGFLLTDDVNQQVVLSVRPGLTSAATLQYRNEEVLLASADDVERFYVEHVLPAKLEIDAGWLESRTFFGDLHLLVATVAAILSPTNSEPSLVSSEIGCSEEARADS